MGRDNVQNEEIEIDIGHILSILWDKILVIIATGLNLLGITKIKLMNYIPAMFLPILLCLFI